MLNYFPKWIRLLSFSKLFINDLHIWIAWSPWSFQIMLIEKWILLKSLEFKRQHKYWLKKNTLSHILPIFIFLYFFWRFDETFDMVLPEGTELSKTYLLFSVKDQSPVLGEGLLLGEALLPLADIVKEDGDVSLKVSLYLFFRLRSSASSLYIRMSTMKPK